MKVKIGNTVHDAGDQPIMIILTDNDKALIASMRPDAYKYCAYPIGMSCESIKRWMENTHEPVGTA